MEIDIDYSIDTSEPIIADNTKAILRLVEETTDVTERGDPIVKQKWTLTEPVASDTTDQFGEPIMIHAGYQISHSFWFGETDKEGRKQHPNMSVSYKENNAKQWVKFLEAIHGKGNVTKALAEESRIGVELLCKVGIDKKSNEPRNIVKGFVGSAM